MNAAQRWISSGMYERIVRGATRMVFFSLNLALCHAVALLLTGGRGVTAVSSRWP